MTSLKYLRVTVPYYIPIAVLSMLVGAVLTINTLPGITALYAAICLSFVVGGFNTLNGVYDKAIDKINKPSRPIPLGEISTQAGVIYAILLYLIAFFIAIFIGIEKFTIIVLLSMLITVSYSLPIPSLRSKFVINTLTGLFFYGFLCPLAGWSLYSAYPIPMPLIIFMLLLGSGIAITKDFEDVEGDKLFGIKTLPTVLGVRGAASIVATLIFISFIYIGVITLMGIISIYYLSTFIFLPWSIFVITSLRKNNTRDRTAFFLKNILLVISIELLLIVVTII